MPQRFLRPEIRNSKRWNAVSLKAQSLWVRLLTMVDDFGRCDGRASVICGNCWAVWNERHPSDAVNPQETAALCCELQAAGMLEIYSYGDKEVLQLLQWQERARSEKSKWPDPHESAAERSGTLPNPASLALVPSPEAKSHVSTTEHSRGVNGAERPSWKEWWQFCSSPQCGLGDQAYAKDKFLAAESDNWKGKTNWRAYASRCRTWWESERVTKKARTYAP